MIHFTSPAPNHLSPGSKAMWMRLADVTSKAGDDRRAKNKIAAPGELPDAAFCYDHPVIGSGIRGLRSKNSLEPSSSSRHRFSFCPFLILTAWFAFITRLEACRILVPGVFSATEFFDPSSIFETPAPRPLPVLQTSSIPLSGSIDSAENRPLRCGLIYSFYAVARGRGIVASAIPDTFPFIILGGFWQMDW